MAQQVSVRLAVVGGTQFRNDLTAAGRDGSQAMDRISNSSSRMGQPVQNASQILGQYAGQAMRGGGASQSFADVIPRLVSGFGMLNPIAAIAGGILGGLAAELFKGGESALEMSKKMGSLEGSVGNVEGAASRLEAVQREYNRTIAQTGGASSSAAALVLANSKAEFQARKEVLSVELQLLRVRGDKMALDARELQDKLQFESKGAEIIQRDTERAMRVGKYSWANAWWRGDDAEQEYAGPSTKKFVDKNEEAILQLRKLKAETDLTALSIKSTEALMDTEFKDITTGGAGIKPDKPGKGGAGGATKEQNAALKEQQKLFDETRTKAERYAIEVEKIEALYKSGAISTDVYQRKMAMLKETYEAQGAFASSVATTLKSSMDSLFTGIFEGGNKAAESVENLGKKLASMATQQATYQLLAKLMPATFGAGGFIPLLENANGNAFSGGQVTAFATGGVFDSPVMFPMKGGAGMLGEAGPEAIMPLTRIGGKLGVRAAGGGGGGGGQVVQIIDQRGKNAPEVERTSRRGPDGAEYVTMIIKDATARGDLDGANRARFASAPQKVKR